MNKFGYVLVVCLSVGLLNPAALAQSSSDIPSAATTAEADSQTSSSTSASGSTLGSLIGAAVAAAGNGEPASEPEAAESTLPAIDQLGLYIKELTFTRPDDAPITPEAYDPAFDVSIAVRVKKSAEDTYGVDLIIAAAGTQNGTELFKVDLVYGGMYRLIDVPDQQISQVLMIEAPRLIFPFARQVLANVTQEAGFPPLLMEPVDFVAMYRDNLRTLAEQLETESETGAE